MKKYDLYGGIFWLVMAFFVSGMGLKFGLGTIGYPGPGFFPFLVGLILLGLSIGIILMAVKERRIKKAGFGEWPFFRRNVFFILAILFAYGLSLEYLGYVLGSLFLMVYLFKVPGQQKWWFSTVVTVAMVAMTYYFFGVLLQAQFPKGVFNIG
jgi:hypothetical protein